MNTTATHAAPAVSADLLEVLDTAGIAYGFAKWGSVIIANPDETAFARIHEDDATVYLTITDAAGAIDSDAKLSGVENYAMLLAILDAVLAHI